MAMAAQGVPVILYASTVFLPMVRAQLARDPAAPVTVVELPHPFGTVAPAGLARLAADTLRDHADLFSGFGSGGFGGEAR